MSKQRLCLDLQLQLVEYLYHTNIVAWFKLLQLTGFDSSKDFYSAYLYLLRKRRYVLTANEINLLKRYIVRLPDNKWIYILFKKAANNGHLLLVKYLVKHGANVHANNGEVLQLAAYNGHLQVVKYLFQNNTNISSSVYHAALGRSSENRHLAVMKYLLKQRKKYNLSVRNKYGRMV